MNSSLDGSPRTTNPSALSSKLNEASKAEEKTLNLSTSSMPSRPPTIQTIKRNSLLEMNPDNKRIQQVSEDQKIMVKTHADTPIPHYDAPKLTEPDNKYFGQPSNSDNSNTHLISSRSRTVDLGRQQCACFPYFKYLGCGKIYNNE